MGKVTVAEHTTELNRCVSLRYFLEHYCTINGRKPNWTEEELVVADIHDLAEELGVIPFFVTKGRGGVTRTINPRVYEEYLKRKKTT